MFFALPVDNPTDESFDRPPRYRARYNKIEREKETKPERYCTYIHSMHVVEYSLRKKSREAKGAGIQVRMV